MTTRLLGSEQLAPEELAQRIALRYVSDDVPGIGRRRAGRGFVYLSPSRRPIRDGRTRERIESLAIPPAWKDVWISPWPTGHIQATGRDDRDRKQYIYHAKWRQAAGQVKFARLRSFGLSLPKLRRRAREHLQACTAGKERLLAGMVHLLDASLLRVGNDEYALQNGTYGLTTLRRQHVSVKGTNVALHFPAKGGQPRRIRIEDATVARFLKGCHRAAARSRLFCYRDDGGQWCEVHANDLNEYLALLSGGDVTAKDFRTWKGTCVAAWQLFEHRDEQTKSRRKKIVLEAIDEAAEVLGNTRSVCRAHYVHPGILESYEAGEFPSACKGLKFRRRRWLGREEQLTLHLLERLEG